MNARELAAKLDGNPYGDEISAKLAERAKENGLVVVFGYSDDNVELRGAIDDEIGAYNGTTFHIIKDGLLKNECDEEDCPHFAKLQELATPIIAKRNAPGSKFQWTFETDIPHETFEIYEPEADGRIDFCRGIVFSINDVPSSEAVSFEQFKAAFSDLDFDKVAQLFMLHMAKKVDQFENDKHLVSMEATVDLKRYKIEASITMNEIK